MTTVTNSNGLSDTEVGEGSRLGRTLVVKNFKLATVATVMFPVCERERSSTAETNIRVDPFWCGTGVYHSRIGECEVFRRKFVSWGALRGKNSRRASGVPSFLSVL
jgi:hypothetical protein